jgi:hypothetical protein
MILRAWGTWSLFQSLLQVLREIGDRHGGVSIANIAIRWVLDHPFVGAVIIGEFIMWTASLMKLIPCGGPFIQGPDLVFLHILKIITKLMAYP